MSKVLHLQLNMNILHQQCGTHAKSVNVITKRILYVWQFLGGTPRA